MYYIIFVVLNLNIIIKLFISNGKWIISILKYKTTRYINKSNI